MRGCLVAVIIDVAGIVPVVVVVVVVVRSTVYLSELRICSNHQDGSLVGH